MSLSQLENDLGVFVLTNGPTAEEITKSFWADATGRKKRPVTFKVMPGILVDEEGKRAVAPLLYKPMVAVAIITGMQQELRDARPARNCVNLTVRIERKPASIAPLPEFSNCMTVYNIFTPGTPLRLSYNVKTRMGGIALNGQQCLVTSQDYWEARTADGWLMAADPPKKGQEDSTSTDDGEQSTSAW